MSGAKELQDSMGKSTGDWHFTLGETQGGTDRLNRILKLYHSTATQILRITGGGRPTARIMVNTRLHSLFKAF